MSTQPGRTVDHLQRNVFSLAGIKYDFSLCDRADRLILDQSEGRPLVSCSDPRLYLQV